MTRRSVGPVAGEDRPLAAAELPAAARRLLAAGEVERYGELFASLPAIADAQRRYRAAVELLDSGLAASASVPPAQLPALLARVAAGALDALEREPREPRLLALCGVALRELGSLDAAAAMLAAAHRLDPQLASLAGEPAALDAARAPAGGGRSRALHADAPVLAERAADLAARAQPAEGLRLSLCMIVRDEQEMLGRCLASVAKAVDEILVVDTGSRDATVEIARSFGARVIERPWNGSFAEARNASFDAAGGDWLMYLDADEALVGEDAERLRSLTGRTWREAFSVTETSHTGAPGEGTAVVHEALRIFRNRPEYRFEGRVHEQIAARLPAELPERVEASGVRVEHFGYLADVRAARGKSRRNIELLRLQQAEGPASAFLHFNLGSELAAAGEHLAALAELEFAWSLLADAGERGAHEFAPRLVLRLVKALRACERPAAALERAQQALERFPDFTDLVFEQALASVALGERDRALALAERCLQMGDAPPRYAATLGAGGALARGLAAVLEAWRELAGGCEGPAALGREALAPLRAVLEVLLQAQDFIAFELLAGLLERTPLHLRERRELLAEMYLRHGYAASAAEEWMSVCREQPDARALVGLARVAVARGMAGEARELAAAALSHDPGDAAAAGVLEQAEAAIG
jgi:tetratricopeptide (TPR) repeat protein